MTHMAIFCYAVHETVVNLCQQPLSLQLQCSPLALSCGGLQFLPGCSKAPCLIQAGLQGTGVYLAALLLQAAVHMCRTPVMWLAAAQGPGTGVVFRSAAPRTPALQPS